MTALIGTGHSIDQKNDDVKGSFRPQAVVQLWSSDRQLWMIAAGVYGFIAMLRFY